MMQTSLFIILQYYHGRGYYGTPYDSAAGTPVVMFWVVLTIMTYLTIRVLWGLHKDKKISIKHHLTK
jgi:hypothetical protein